jgi:hypothetical protein
MRKGARLFRPHREKNVRDAARPLKLLDDGIGEGGRSVTVGFGVDRERALPPAGIHGQRGTEVLRQLRSKAAVEARLYGSVPGRLRVEPTTRGPRFGGVGIAHAWRCHVGRDPRRRGTRLGGSSSRGGEAVEEHAEGGDEMVGLELPGPEGELAKDPGEEQEAVMPALAAGGRLTKKGMVYRSWLASAAM